MDDKIAALAKQTEQRLLATWAADCAERVLPCFERKFPADDRPRRAIEACREWVRTGLFKMADVRTTSLAAHAAAREVEEDDAARSAARAAGQALGTAHVPTHAIHAARYAATAVRDAAGSMDAAIEEREWQYRRLRALSATPYSPSPRARGEGVAR
ncbi:MAG: putative immunity protein [Dehalococcoidia bacterium]